MIEVGLLGSMEVSIEGERVELAGSLEKALLARLALTPGRDVTRDRLIDDLWGDRPPGNAVGSLQTLIYRLRKTLAPSAGVVVRSDNGYRLDIPPEDVDATRFDLLVERAHASPEGGPLRRALLGEALRLWRGPAFSGLDAIPFVVPQRASLEAARMCILEERIEADLGTGAGAELVAELEGLVAEHPLDEKLWGHLMVALYRSGSQAAALRSFERLRTLLADELGIAPSPELVALEHSVLTQDPSLSIDEKLGVQRAGPAGRPTPTSTSMATVLVTDLEGRAKLWDRSPQAMARVMKQYEDLVVEVMTHHGGSVLSRADGGSYSLFDRPSDALAAALDLQRSAPSVVIDEPDHRLPVTVAVHTGEVEIVEGNVFGSVLHIASRLAQVAFGGQVVLSSASAEFTRDGLPPGCELLDLGYWSLPDITRPLHAYELRHRDLGGAHRALHAGRPGTGTLPVPSTSFIGREAELSGLLRLLGASPVVTLTGVGGVGKTRLAVEAGAAQMAGYPGGVWFCTLSTVTTEDEVLERIASALGLHASSLPELAHEVADWFRFSPALLIVDNCEHVAAEMTAVLAPALETGGSATLLVTSRRPLRLAGETVMRVDPLGRRTEPAGAETPDPGVLLLVDRARAAGASLDIDDPSLIDIVERVEGLPLAIELAARRLTSMTPMELVARMSPSFDLIESDDGRPDGPRTLRATIDWSFGLLEPPSRVMLAALSACRGGFGLDLAEALGAAVGMTSAVAAKAVADLWDQSLIGTEGVVPGKARYRMLALINEYTARKLAADGLGETVSQAHGEYFARLAEQLVGNSNGPDEPSTIATIDVEFDNIRAAFTRSLAARSWDTARSLLLSLAPELVLRERVEVVRWAAEALRALGEEDHPVRSVALAIAANAALVEGRFGEAESLSRQSLDSEVALGVPAGWLSRNVLALVRAAGAQLDSAHRLLGEMAELTAVSGDPMPRAVALFDRALMASFSRNPASGRVFAEELVLLGDQCGGPSLRAMGQVSIGRALATDDPERARAALTDAVALAERSRSSLLLRQAKRAISEIDTATGGQGAGFRGLQALLEGFGDTGDLSQQLQTVLTALDLLIAVGAFEVATLLGAALGQTALGSVARCDRVLSVARARLSTDVYGAAFRRGSSLTPAELVSVAAVEFEALTNRHGPA